MKRKAYVVPLSEVIEMDMSTCLCVSGPYTPPPPPITGPTYGGDDDEDENEDSEGDGIAE